MLFKKEEYRLQFKVRVKLLYEMVKDNNIKSQIPYIRSTLINNVNKMIHPFHQNSVKLILEIIDYLIINEHRIALLNLQYNDLLDIIEATATEYINHYEEQGCMILLEGSRNKFIDDPIFNTIVEYEDLAMWIPWYRGVWTDCGCQGSGPQCLYNPIPFAPEPYQLVPEEPIETNP